MPDRKRKLEVACDGYEAGRLAWERGADRIELCAALEVGGLTPTLGTLRRIKRDCPGLEVMAMLRNRAAGFCYREEEFQTMLEDVEDLLEAGADGIVFGFLTEEGRLDEKRMRKIANPVLAAKKEAVLHRAFDATIDPLESLKQAIDLGLTRVLSSGPEGTAYEGRYSLKAYLDFVEGKIQILPGVGIKSNNAEEILKVTGATQLHASCKTYLDDPTTYGRADYRIPGLPRPTAFQFVDGEEIERLAKMVHLR